MIVVMWIVRFIMFKKRKMDMRMDLDMRRMRMMAVKII